MYRIKKYYILGQLIYTIEQKRKFWFGWRMIDGAFTEDEAKIVLSLYEMVK